MSVRIQTRIQTRSSCCSFTITVRVAAFENPVSRTLHAFPKYAMSAALNKIQTIEDAGRYIAEINTDIPLSGEAGECTSSGIGTEYDCSPRTPLTSLWYTGPGIARCNVYRPKETGSGAKFPVIMVSV